MVDGRVFFGGMCGRTDLFFESPVSDSGYQAVSGRYVHDPRCCLLFFMVRVTLWDRSLPFFLADVWHGFCLSLSLSESMDMCAAWLRLVAFTCHNQLTFAVCSPVYGDVAHLICQNNEFS